MGSPELRAGDDDREAVATRLRAAHAAGQLDVDEVEQRLAAAYAARTFGDLEPLTADLGPAPAAPPEPPESRRARRRRKEIREWAGLAVLLNAIWIITCVAAGELLFYWPMFPLGIWGAVIVSQVLFGAFDDGHHKGHGHGHRLHPPKPPDPPDPPKPPRLP